MKGAEREKDPSIVETDRRLTVLNEAIHGAPIYRLEFDESFFGKPGEGERFIAVSTGYCIGNYDPPLSLLYGSRAPTVEEALEKTLAFSKKLNQGASEKMGAYVYGIPKAIVGLETEGFCLSQEEIDRLWRPISS